MKIGFWKASHIVILWRVVWIWLWHL